MNYYEEFFSKVDELIKEENIEEALYRIKEELEIVYIPKDIEVKLLEYRNKLEPLVHKEKEISMEKIESYLFSDPEKQLIAVSMLSKKNLRNEIDLVNRYLSFDGYANAKALLIASLIEQEISDEIHYINEGMEISFIPRFILLPEESDGYLSAKKLLEDFYMKEPSKLSLAMDLLYKEVMLMLPMNAESEEGELLFKKISNYIESAFNN